MGILIVILGIIVAGAGIVGVLNPRRLVRLLITFWKRKYALWIVVALGLAFGVALLVASASSRFPILIRILGVIAIVAALAPPILGGLRMKLIVMWWASRPSKVIRVWSVAAVACGALLVYAGL